MSEEEYCERGEMCYIEFTTEETDGIDVKRYSSSVCGETLEDCMKYTNMLHERGGLIEQL